MNNEEHCEFILHLLQELANEVHELYELNRLRTGDLYWAREQLADIMQKYVEGLTEVDPNPTGRELENYSEKHGS